MTETERAAWCAGRDAAARLLDFMAEEMAATNDRPIVSDVAAVLAAATVVEMIEPPSDDA